MTVKETYPVFVYGTLKRGFPNYDETLLGTCFQEPVCTRERYPLVIANRYYSPVMIDEPGSGFSVSGELYCVTQTILTRLDELESVGQQGGYHRQLIDVIKRDGATLQASAYFKYRENLEKIQEGPMAEYPLDERYVPAAKRQPR